MFFDIPDDLNAFGAQILADDSKEHQICLHDLLIALMDNASADDVHATGWKAADRLVQSDPYDALKKPDIADTARVYLERFLSGKLSAVRAPETAVIMDHIILTHEMPELTHVVAKMMDIIMTDAVVDNISDIDDALKRMVKARFRIDVEAHGNESVVVRLGAPDTNVPEHIGVDGFPKASLQGGSANPLVVLELPEHDGVVDCSICHNKTDNDDGNDRITRLPCGHEFHRACVRTWLQSSNNCPHCRAELDRRDPENTRSCNPEEPMGKKLTVDEVNDLIGNRVCHWSGCALVDAVGTYDNWMRDTNGDMVQLKCVKLSGNKYGNKLVRTTFATWCEKYMVTPCMWTLRILDDTDRFYTVTKNQFGKTFEDLATPMRVTILVNVGNAFYKQPREFTVNLLEATLEAHVTYI